MNWLDWLSALGLLLIVACGVCIIFEVIDRQSKE